MNSRKLAALQVTPEFLIEFCKSGEHHFQVTDHALPADAKIVSVGSVGIEYSVRRHTLLIVLQSEEFQPVPEGQIIPLLPAVQFERNRSTKKLERKLTTTLNALHTIDEMTADSGVNSLTFKIWNICEDALNDIQNLV